MRGYNPLRGTRQPVTLSLFDAYFTPNLTFPRQGVRDYWEIRLIETVLKQFFGGFSGLLHRIRQSYLRTTYASLFRPEDG